MLLKDESLFFPSSALTNVRIHEIEEQNGDYLCLLNISNTEDYDLSGHFLQQNIACIPLCRFRFPVNTIIKAGQTVTVNKEKRNSCEKNIVFLKDLVWHNERDRTTTSTCICLERAEKMGDRT